ncbi:MAG: hypothetical protein KDC12_11585, partial [Flavobacteriales bacterium]|nr:hypothetical protein [Flavobacteriales bacterium]
MHYPSDDQEEILDLPEKEESPKPGQEHSPLAIASGVVLIAGVIAMAMEMWWWRYVVMFGAVLLII